MCLSSLGLFSRNRPRLRGESHTGLRGVARWKRGVRAGMTALPVGDDGGALCCFLGGVRQLTSSGIDRAIILFPSPSLPPSPFFIYLKSCVRCAQACPLGRYNHISHRWLRHRVKLDNVENKRDFLSRGANKSDKFDKIRKR